MYAIIEDGSRQLKVEEGQELDIDFRDLAAGEEIKFERVLAFRDDSGLKIGRPALPAGRRYGQGGIGRAGSQAGCPEVPSSQETTAAAPATVSSTPAC